MAILEDSDISDESVPWDKQVVLHIGETASKKTKEVYRGSYKTSGWEWFSENEVLVSYGCGTECEVLYLINIVSGQKKLSSKELAMSGHQIKTGFLLITIAVN